MKKAPHPGIFIKEGYLKPLGISISEAAQLLGVTRKTLSELVNGRAGISPLMALRLSRAFSTSPEVWTGMQTSYDLGKEMKNPLLKKVKKIYPTKKYPSTIQEEALIGDQGV